MKKLIVLVILGLILGLQPEVFAKTICFAGGGGATGSFFFFSGGKVDQKPFSGNWIIPGFCNVPAWGSIIADSIGNIHISVNTVHDPITACTSVWFSATGPTTASMSGQFDNGQDGTFEGSFTMTEVNCGSIPTAKPEAIPTSGAGVPQKSEK